MPIDRKDYFPAREEWNSLFRKSTSEEAHKRWWKEVLVGEEEIVTFLKMGRKGSVDPKKRLKQILDSHSVEGGFASGDIFSTYSRIQLVPYRGNDKRRKRPIPICWNKERLQQEWNDYQYRIKPAARKGAADYRHRGIAVELPPPANDEDMLKQLGYLNEEKAEITIRSEANEAPIRSNAVHRFEIQSNRFLSFSDALAFAIEELLSSLPGYQLPPIESEELEKIAQRQSTNLYYVTFADRSIAIRRVVPKQAPVVTRHPDSAE